MGTIGVLGLQGCVKPHRPHLEALGLAYREVRSEADFEGLRALILPGGESTTMLKLIAALGLEPALRRALERLPVWGICAGAILLARHVPGQRSFGVLDIDVERNAYGRQLASFEAEVEGYPVAFIRAPRIRRVGSATEVRAERGGAAIWVTQGKAMATAFHPELSREYPSPMHQAFTEIARGSPP